MPNCDRSLMALPFLEERSRVLSDDEAICPDQATASLTSAAETRVGCQAHENGPNYPLENVLVQKMARRHSPFLCMCIRCTVQTTR